MARVSNIKITEKFGGYIVLFLAELKVLVLTFKVLYDLGPWYLRDRLVHKIQPVT